MTAPVPLPSWELVRSLWGLWLCGDAPLQDGGAGRPEVCGERKLTVQEPEDIISGSDKYMWRRFGVGFGVRTVVLGAFWAMPMFGLAILIFSTDPTAILLLEPEPAVPSVRLPDALTPVGAAALGTHPRAHRTWRRRAESGPKAGGAQARVVSGLGKHVPHKCRGQGFSRNCFYFRNAQGGRFQGVTRELPSEEAGPGKQGQAHKHRVSPLSMTSLPRRIHSNLFSRLLTDPPEAYGLCQVLTPWRAPLSTFCPS